MAEDSRRLQNVASAFNTVIVLNDEILQECYLEENSQISKGDVEALESVRKRLRKAREELPLGNVSQELEEEALDILCRQIIVELGKGIDESLTLIDRITPTLSSSSLNRIEPSVQLLRKYKRIEIVFLDFLDSASS